MGGGNRKDAEERAWGRRDIASDPVGAGGGRRRDAEGSDWAPGETQGVVDRLEAALDEALLAHAARAARLGRPRDRIVTVRIPLRSLNDRLSQTWRWKKRGIVRIFRERLAARYAASGWGRARADYDSDQAKWVNFYFDAEAVQSIDGASARDMLGMIREVADALGAEPPTDAPGWLRAAMDDLRLAAKYRMLDLEAASREAER